MEEKINPQYREAFEDHLLQFCEERDILIFNDKDQEGQSVDVYWIKPFKNIRPFSILITCGIGQSPMNTEGQSAPERVELVMLLPGNWPLQNNLWKEPENYWPIEHLTHWGKIPSEENSWIGYGHTSTVDEDDTKCFPGTSFNSTLLLNSFTLPVPFCTFKFNKNEVNIHTLVPLYSTELQHKITQGLDSLLDLFIKNQVPEILNINRKNCV